MEEPRVKKRVRIGDIRKQTSCCASSVEMEQEPLFYQESSCCPPKKAPETSASNFVPPIVQTVSTDWLIDDYLGQIRCRVSSYRNSYIVTPGLYAVGRPDNGSDVFASANYKLSFDILRSSLKGMNAWVIVLDTKGINVWCAAGKRTFGTDELIRRISDAHLDKVVSHKRIILPQLGAPGIAAHVVSKKTGFRVYYGPVHAKDIPAYIASGYNATKEMRTVRFTWLDRLVLTPMEMIPALKKFPVYALFVLLIFGLQPSGIFFREAAVNGWPFLLLGLLSVFSGAFLTPLSLPFVPSRAFAVKGWIVGFIFVLLAQGILRITDKSLLAFIYLFFPLLSSYIALQFTGSTAFTGMSGVKKELRYALPVYKAAAAISFLLLVISRLGQWGIL
ncbi:MAG: mercury methylation corrinoid protein HgcA [Deltaproteobacteria bacterium]|nr:mercury methylation corrinoid protein HgcA [Deltaproteobacteria bacterium]